MRRVIKRKRLHIFEDEIVDLRAAELFVSRLIQRYCDDVSIFCIFRELNIDAGESSSDIRCACNLRKVDLRKRVFRGSSDVQFPVGAADRKLRHNIVAVAEDGKPRFLIIQIGNIVVAVICDRVCVCLPSERVSGCRNRKTRSAGRVVNVIYGVVNHDLFDDEH